MTCYRGWFTYGGLEFANSTRTFDMLEGGLPPTNDQFAYTFIEQEPGLFTMDPPWTDDPVNPGLFLLNPPFLTETEEGLFWINDGIAGGTVCKPCGGVQVRYRDDWTGFKDWVGDELVDYTDLVNAPWFDPDQPASQEFRGILVMDVQGLDAVPVQRDLSESICDGGVTGYHRDTSRRIRFNAVLVGCTHAGAQYGLNWLACLLRSGKTTTGLPLRFLSASPEGSATAPDTLVRTAENVVLTQTPTIVGYGRGNGSLDHQHSSVLRIEFELATGTPYLWADPQSTLPVFDATPTETIEWVTGCIPGAGGCPTPVDTLVDPLCPSPSLPVSPIPPSLGCGTENTGACIPLCSGSRLAATYDPGTTGSWGCGEQVIDLLVTNNDVDAVRGVTLWWVYCGDDPECNALSTAEISYIPAGATLTLDGVRGRVRALVDGAELSAPGIVSGGSGAPWSPQPLDSTLCYQLVLAAPTDADLTIEIVSRGRDA